MLAHALGTFSAAYLPCLDDQGFPGEQEWELVRCFRRTDERGRGTILGVAESQCDVPGGDALR